MSHVYHYRIRAVGEEHARRPQGSYKSTGGQRGRGFYAADVNRGVRQVGATMQLPCYYPILALRLISMYEYR